MNAKPFYTIGLDITRYFIDPGEPLLEDRELDPFLRRGARNFI